MVTKTATRPAVRSSHTHTATPSQRPASRTPLLSPPSRVAASVGQAYPPSLNSTLKPSGSGTLPDSRTSSPNYFGLIVDPATDPRDSGVGPKGNWSPPTSSIQSFGAISPKHLPLESNVEFEAFRRQSETNHNFNLSHGNLSYFASTPGTAPIRPKSDRKSGQSEVYEHDSSPRFSAKVQDDVPDRMDLDSGRGAAHKSPDSKRTMDPSGVPSFFDIPRQQSPANMTISPIQRNVLSYLDDRHPRLSLPQNKIDPPFPSQSAPNRADTLPLALEEGPILVSPGHVKDMIERMPPSQFLLLDLRVFPQFSHSRIRGALNLCIPTTLLKRPSFNLQKLQDTFTNEREKERFSQWKSAKYIIVYDAFSSDKKDAMSAVNTLKKFSNEGWKGQSYILRGGFKEFAKIYSDHIDTQSSQETQSSKISLSLGTSAPELPVAGGCVMPASKNAANPFFSNIRQNQDLIGGVGQMSVKLPEALYNAQEILPKWLSGAVTKEDGGKTVSDKFLHLELEEQSRMTKALSAGMSYGTQTPNPRDVQIAGIEKGSKNRYNNIWPFEHARVKLQGRPEGSCDYVNASHIKSLRSNKKYIASQGPLPATFEDFWSVIWDEDVRVIVMLTAEQEGGQLKCHPYWSSKEYGPLKLKLLSEKKVSLDLNKHRSVGDRHDSSRDGRRRRANTTTESPKLPSSAPETPYVIIRKFTLSHAGHPFSPMREVTQAHYSLWPDFGAPASPAQLVALVELSNQLQRAASSSTQSPRSSEPENDEAARPMLVHCSAGCGRTGTFCTIDSVIDMLKRQRREIRSGITPMEGMTSVSGDYMGKGSTKKEELDQQWIFDQDFDLVQKTVEDFRGQRLSMVQSLRQYVLCYETVLEWMTQQLQGVTKTTGRERSGSDSELA